MKPIKCRLWTSLALIDSLRWEKEGGRDAGAGSDALRAFVGFIRPHPVQSSDGSSPRLAASRGSRAPVPQCRAGAHPVPGNAAPTGC